jgi:SAM-dependent methyltransferase
VKAEAYEAWYDSPRGRWISEVEFRLLHSLLRPEAGASLLDIGCGTGHFTRMFACSVDGTVVGVDPNEEWLAYARRHRKGSECYVAGRAEALPFADASFDNALSVTALCFIERQDQALSEMLRVTRRRIVLGLLNRHSLLYLHKGRCGGKDGYSGAHWHSPAEIRNQLGRLPVRNLEVRSAINLPSGGRIAEAVESRLPNRCLLGGFLAVAADVAWRRTPVE